MSEQQATYTLNPHYQQWAAEFDIEDDLTRFPPHVHVWELGYSYLGGIENEKQVAFCDGCGAVMWKEEIEAVLNKAVQS